MLKEFKLIIISTVSQLGVALIYPRTLIQMLTWWDNQGRGCPRGVLIEIGESQLNVPVYVALLQDDMFLSNDFLQKNEIQLSYIKGEFHVGARLTKKPMF